MSDFDRFESDLISFGQNLEKWTNLNILNEVLKDRVPILDPLLEPSRPDEALKYQICIACTRI